MEVKSKRGGARKGAGRPRIIRTAEEIAEVVAEQERMIAQELVFPALCQAFRADPGQYQERYLTVEISKTDIKRAYGPDGLAFWQRHFTQKKRGGIDRFHNGYKTQWCLQFGQYALSKMLVESLGHTLKDLPAPGFPPVALQERLSAIDARREARQQKMDCLTG